MNLLWQIELCKYATCIHNDDQTNTDWRKFNTILSFMEKFLKQTNFV